MATLLSVQSVIDWFSSNRVDYNSLKLLLSGEVGALQPDGMLSPYKWALCAV